MTEQIAKRVDHEAKVKAAWAELALSPAFKTAFESMQVHFDFLGPSFAKADGYNPVPAAMRDGEKNVLRHIAKKLSLGLAVAEDDNATDKQREAL